MSELTAERLRELLHYDPETGLFTSLVARASLKAGKVVGSTSVHGRYLQMGVDGTTYFAHRLAWLYVHGRWPDGNIDHINGCGTDNRLSNLRDVPQRVNLQNIRAPKVNSSSGIQGVRYLHRRNSWQARITVNRKEIHLGYYKTPEDARDAFLAAKRRLHEGCTI